MVSRLPKIRQRDSHAQPNRPGWNWTPTLLGEGRSPPRPPPQSDLRNFFTGAVARSSVHSALQLENQTLEYKATNHQSRMAWALDVSKPIFSP